MKKLAFDRQISDLIKDLHQSEAAAGPQTGSPAPPPDLVSLLRKAAKAAASDLILVKGYPPCVRIHGSISSLSGERLSGERIKQLCFPLLDVRARKAMADNHAVDLSFSIEGLGRFRCNLHFQQKSTACAIRLLPAGVPSLEELHLPALLAKVVEPLSGLVLVTGPTGCGKSTTLAALIRILNETTQCHIITIEDPVEYVHPTRKALVEHIEIGSDGLAFSTTLKYVLRQDPDVILVGEMRDLETMRLAITAAETGHLVLSTLHTHNSVQSIHRIIDVFPAEQQEQIRFQLSASLAAVIAQQLLPTMDGKGRLPALEILLASPAVRKLIRFAQMHQLYSHMETQLKAGMRTMERSLAELVKQQKVARHEAAKRVYYVEEFEKLL